MKRISIAASRPLSYRSSSATSCWRSVPNHRRTGRVIHQPPRSGEPSSPNCASSCLRRSISALSCRRGAYTVLASDGTLLSPSYSSRQRTLKTKATMTVLKSAWSWWLHQLVGTRSGSLDAMCSSPKIEPLGSKPPTLSLALPAAAARSSNLEEKNLPASEPAAARLILATRLGGDSTASSGRTADGAISSSPDASKRTSAEEKAATCAKPKKGLQGEGKPAHAAAISDHPNAAPRACAGRAPSARSTTNKPAPSDFLM